MQTWGGRGSWSGRDSIEEEVADMVIDGGYGVTRRRVRVFGGVH